MSEFLQIQFVRGTTAANQAYTGPAGTFSIDTQLKQVRIHDGVTAGGSVIPGIADLNALQTLIQNLAITDIAGLETALAGKVNASLLGQANGVATLDADGRIPASQLPSYVDDVLEYADFAALPVSGETGKIYITLDNNKVFRWSGTVYVEIVAAPGSTDSVTEGLVNKYFTEARARAALSATGDLNYDAETGVFSYTAPVKTVNGKTGNETGEVTLDKADVGLANVENYAPATQIQAEAADATDAYMTPLAVRQLLEHIGFSRDVSGNWSLDQGVLA